MLKLSPCYLGPGRGKGMASTRQSSHSIMRRPSASRTSANHSSPTASGPRTLPTAALSTRRLASGAWRVQVGSNWLCRTQPASWRSPKAPSKAPPFSSDRPWLRAPDQPRKSRRSNVISSSTARLFGTHSGCRPSGSRLLTTLLLSFGASDSSGVPHGTGGRGAAIGASTEAAWPGRGGTQNRSLRPV